MTQNTVFQCVKNIFFPSQKKLVFFTEFNLSMIDKDNANFWFSQSCVGPGSAQLSAKSEDTEFDGAFYLSVHGIYGRNKIDSGGGAR